MPVTETLASSRLVQSMQSLIENKVFPWAVTMTELYLLTELVSVFLLLKSYLADLALIA